MAFLIAALFVSNVAVIVRHDGNGDDGTAFVDPGGAGTPTIAPADLTAVVKELQTFVAAERGLAFKADVKVALLDDAAFKRELTEDPPDATDIKELTTDLTALGLIEPDVDVIALLTEFVGAAVVGLYDPETKELYVRGAAITPYTRQVMVHELTHALQDQHFSIDRPELDDVDDEQGIAFTTLVEGDAVRIDTAYRESLSPADQHAAAKEEFGLGGEVGDDIPEALISLLTFPYEVGPVFAETLVKRGRARLDRAFSQPPTSTEQLLHPEKFISGEAALEVAAPTPDGRVVDQGVLGELGLTLFLEGSVGDNAAAVAASGWGGDRYVSWEKGGRSCLRFRVVMDDPKNRLELLDTLDKVASRRPGVTVDDRTPVEVTTCA